MKIILILLMAIFFNNSAFSAIIISSPRLPQKIFNQRQTTAFQEDNIQLKVPSVVQVGTDYCVAASLISIFSYRGWEKDKTQSQIYQEARIATKTSPAIPGTPIDELLAAYLNDFIYKNTGKEAGYHLHSLDATFGILLADIAIFSTYVWGSLSLNIPILMGILPASGFGHAVVLCGYEENLDNHWYDNYVFMNPANGKFFGIMAQDIHCDFKYGMYVLGYGNMLQISNRIELKIDPFEKEVKDIPGNNKPIFADEVRINLTKNTGISDFSYFNQAFDLFLLPEFKSEIKKVNDDSDVKDSFGILSAALPQENVDNWQSKHIIIHSFLETIGCQTIKTWVSLKILIQRELNNELILRLLFSGGSKVTKNKNLREYSTLYELTGRVKINSGSKMLLKRKNF